MKPGLAAAGALLLAAGCSGERTADPRAAPMPEPARGPVTTATLVEQPAPAPTTAADTPEAVVRRYVALATAGRGDEARALWEDPAGAAAVGRQFAGIGDPQVTITGAPELGAGAGQRYATVPIRVTGQRGGTRIDRTGEVVLHRVADGIETDDPAAHQWRIRSATFAG